MVAVVAETALAQRVIQAFPLPADVEPLTLGPASDALLETACLWIVQLDRPGGRTRAAEIGRAMRRFPWLPVVAVVDPEHDPAELVELGGLGVRRVATWPSGEPAEAWRRNLVDVVCSAVGDVVRRTMNSADPTVAECLAWSTALAHKLPEAADLAEITGFSPRALARHLKRHGGLTPGQTLTLGRVIQALYRLAMTNQPVERVALGVGFASGSGLRRALGRTLGRTPSAYRRRGAVVEAMESLVSDFGQSGRRDVH